MSLGSGSLCRGAAVFCSGGLSGCCDAMLAFSMEFAFGRHTEIGPSREVARDWYFSFRFSCFGGVFFRLFFISFHFLELEFLYNCNK